MCPKTEVIAEHVSCFNETQQRYYEMLVEREIVYGHGHEMYEWLNVNEIEPLEQHMSRQERHHVLRVFGDVWGGFVDHHEVD